MHPSVLQDLAGDRTRISQFTCISCAECSDMCTRQTVSTNVGSAVALRKHAPQCRTDHAHEKISTPHKRKYGLPCVCSQRWLAHQPIYLVLGVVCTRILQSVTTCCTHQNIVALCLIRPNPRLDSIGILAVATNARPCKKMRQS